MDLQASYLGLFGIKAKDYLNKDGLLALNDAFIYPYNAYRNNILGAI